MAHGPDGQYTHSYTCKLASFTKAASCYPTAQACRGFWKRKAKAKQKKETNKQTNKNPTKNQKKGKKKRTCSSLFWQQSQRVSRKRSAEMGVRLTRACSFLHKNEMGRQAWDAFSLPPPLLHAAFPPLNPAGPASCLRWLSICVMFVQTCAGRSWERKARNARGKSHFAQRPVLKPPPASRIPVCRGQRSKRLLTPGRRYVLPRFRMALEGARLSRPWRGKMSSQFHGPWCGVTLRGSFIRRARAQRFLLARTEGERPHFWWATMPRKAAGEL